MRMNTMRMILPHSYSGSPSILGERDGSHRYHQGVLGQRDVRERDVEKRPQATTPEFLSARLTEQDGDDVQTHQNQDRNIQRRSESTLRIFCEQTAPNPYFDKRKQVGIDAKLLRYKIVFSKNFDEFRKVNEFEGTKDDENGPHNPVHQKSPICVFLLQKKDEEVHSKYRGENHRQDKYRNSQTKHNTSYY